jgi:DEAD/DEAH box helicase domain-containing protein
LHDSFGETLTPEQQQRFQPTLFLYDDYPGGIGLSQPLFERRRSLLTAAIEMIAACGCRDGCPACIGPILSGEEQRGHSAKIAALRVLELLHVG